MTLTRAKFNELTADLVETTMEPGAARRCRTRACRSPRSTRSLLVGGSTRIPAVQEAVKSFTGKEPFKGINPDECVAIGAAIQGGVLGGEVKDVAAAGRYARFLWALKRMGGVCTKLIERNTTIPTQEEPDLLHGGRWPDRG